MTYFSDFAIVTMPFIIMALIGYVMGRIDQKHAQARNRKRDEGEVLLAHYRRVGEQTRQRKR